MFLSIENREIVRRVLNSLEIAAVAAVYAGAQARAERRDGTAYALAETCEIRLYNLIKRQCADGNNAF
jgi:hypothetical protein